MASSDRFYQVFRQNPRRSQSILDVVKARIGIGAFTIIYRQPGDFQKVRGVSEVVPELFEIQLQINEKLDDLGITFEFVVESCNHEFEKDVGFERVFPVDCGHPIL